MRLRRGFGSKYIVEGAENNPEDLPRRPKIVALFILAHDALSRLDYSPDVSSLVSAYKGLSDEIREHLDKGEELPHLTKGKFAPVRKYQDSIMGFLNNGYTFTSDKDERANELTSEIYKLWQTLPLPAYF